MSQEILDDAKLCTLEVTCGTWFNNKRIRNIASGIDLGDGVNVEQLSTNLGPIISDINSLLGAGPGLIGTWAQYPAITNINVNSNNIYSTVNQTFINGSSSITINYETINGFAYTSTSFSTLAQYVAVDSCLLMQTQSNLSSVSTYVSTIGGNVEFLSSAFSTLSYYTAVDSCMTVTNKNNISTLQADLPARRRVAFSTVNLGTVTNADIVGTNISTLGWVTSFTNSGPGATTINLNLNTLNVWPKQQFDCMRFAHVGPGTDSVVHLYAGNSANSATYLDMISPGNSYTYVYSGPLPPTGPDMILSTNYIRFTGV
jgi:hypothetical protein